MKETPDSDERMKKEDGSEIYVRPLKRVRVEEAVSKRTPYADEFCEAKVIERAFAKSAAAPSVAFRSACDFLYDESEASTVPVRIAKIAKAITISITLNPRLLEIFIDYILS